MPDSYTPGVPGVGELCELEENETAGQVPIRPRRGRRESGRSAPLNSLGKTVNRLSGKTRRLEEKKKKKRRTREEWRNERISSGSTFATDKTAKDRDKNFEECPYV